MFRLKSIVKGQTAITVVLLIAAAGKAPGAALDHWTYRSSGISGFANFSTVAYGGGKFVAAGYDTSGVIVSSEDGISWTRRTYGSTQAITAITYGDGKFVGVGANGTIAISTNGENWSSFSISNTTSLNLNGIAHGNGLFVTVGRYPVSGGNYRATIYTSPDAVNWSNWTFDANSSLSDVAYGNGRFVAVGDGFKGTNRAIFVSSNGVDWAPRSSPYAGHLGVAYGNGQFVTLTSYGGARAALTSLDGENWMSHVLSFTNYYISGMGFGNGTYVAVGSLNQSRHILLHSTNGVDWNETRIGPQIGNYFLYDVAFGNETFVVVGQPNAIAQSASVARGWFEGIVRRNSSETELDISGEVGTRYNLQYSSDLVQWRDLFSYTNDWPTVRVTDTSATAPPRFYRVTH